MQYPKLSTNFTLSRLKYFFITAKVTGQQKAQSLVGKLTSSPSPALDTPPQSALCCDWQQVAVTQYSPGYNHSRNPQLMSELPWAMLQTTSKLGDQAENSLTRNSNSQMHTKQHNGNLIL